MRHRHTFNTATLISLAFYSLTFSAALFQAWIIQQERCAAARQRAHKTATYPWKKQTRIEGLQHLTADLRNLRTFGVCMAPERGWFRLKGQISHETRKMSIMLFFIKVKNESDSRFYFWNWKLENKLDAAACSWMGLEELHSAFLSIYY